MRVLGSGLVVRVQRTWRAGHGGNSSPYTFLPFSACRSCFTGRRCSRTFTASTTAPTASCCGSTACQQPCCGPTSPRGQRSCQSASCRCVRWGEGGLPGGGGVAEAGEVFWGGELGRAAQHVNRPATGQLPQRGKIAVSQPCAGVWAGGGGVKTNAGSQIQGE